MKLNYKEKKLLSEEVKTSQEVEFAVKDASLQLQADILETEKQLSSKENKLKDLKTSYPLNTQEIVNCISDIRCLEEGLKILKDLKGELGL
jgi:hypothetical protein